MPSAWKRALAQLIRVLEQMRSDYFINHHDATFVMAVGVDADRFFVPLPKRSAILADQRRFHCLSFPKKEDEQQCELKSCVCRIFVLLRLYARELRLID